MRAWRVQDAKARFSELLRSAAHDGPQAITVRGRAMAVVLSQAEYERLTAHKPPLTAFMRASPLAGTDLDIKRDLAL